MDDPIDTLLVEVRAGTDSFRADIEAMRGTVDSTLTDGFARAGSVLERGLLTAIRRGSLGFDELKSIALRTIDQIAAQALQSGLGNLFGTGPATGGGLASLVGGALGALFGLPGRATGGPVSPGRGYLVGEAGPEIFVPASAGRIDGGTPASSARREVQVSINLAAPRGSERAVALRRSARQVASQVRRALAQD